MPESPDKKKKRDDDSQWWWRWFHAKAQQSEGNVITPTGADGWCDGGLFTGFTGVKAAWFHEIQGRGVEIS